MMMNKASNIAHQIENCLKELEIRYKQDGRFCVFEKSVSSPIREILFMVTHRSNVVAVYGNCPISANSDDSEAMLRMAEFFSRVNYNRHKGSFELDMRDGEINFKVFIDCEGIDLHPAALEKAIESVEAAYEMWGRSILEMIYTDISAKEARVHAEEAMLRDSIKMMKDMMEREDDEEMRGIILQTIEEMELLLGQDVNRE